MLSAMLLGLLAVGAVAQDPAPPVRIWLDHEDGSYMRGDRVKLFLKTRDDRYVVVFHVDPDNRLRVLFPLDPGDDNYVKGGKTYKVINRGGREGFVADIAGRGVVFVAASPDPFRFEQFTKDNFWDYRTLNATPIEGDPELGLVELAQRMTSGRFDYDFLSYGAYAHAGELAPGTDLAYELEPAFSGCLGCAPVNTVVVSAGVPVYCATPLYDPLCYDPLYWSPGYVPPAYWNTGWGYYGGYVGGYYGGGYYGGSYGPSWNAPGWGGGHYPYVPVSPYQPKPWDRQWSGASPAYRPRGATENVNTVVGALPSTGRILRADPRRMWDGSLPIAAPAPATPVAGGAARPSQPAARGQDGDPVTVAAPKHRDRGEEKAKQPAQADPRTRRTWTDDKSSGSGKSTAPAPKAAPSSGGGGSKPSAPTQSSGGGGRRRG
jgi:hypothetical protein